MCGYDMYRIVATNKGFVRFGGCLFTTNQAHLDAMERRFENLFKELTSSIELTGKGNHKVFFETELREMLCPGETIMSDEAY